MNIEGNFMQEASARLIANAFEFVLVKWIDASTVQLVNSNLKEAWFDTDPMDVSQLVSYKETVKLKNHFKSITQEPSSLSFTMKRGSNQINIHCSSQRINGDKLSLWMQLPEVNKSIQYLQNAVHDMKSPVNSIIGVVNLMQHSINEKPDIEELKMFLDMIKITAYKSVNLVNEVMELAEIESPNYVMETEVIWISDFIEMYINTHRLLTIKKKIKITFQRQGDCKVAINKVKMTRVFDNVISNAVKFSKPGTTIHIELGEKGEHVHIAIRDEGIGMPKDVLKELFVKFGNAKRKGLEGETSSGLGLSIVKQIIELHDGEVRVESEENKGTTVLLTIKKLNE